MEFNFYMPVRVLGGAGAVEKYASLLTGLGRRCLIVTGGTSAKKSGALYDVCKALETTGIAYTIFDKIGPNPLISVCHEAGRLARETNAAFLIGIGGGSPMDAAKAAAIFAANPSLSPRDIYAYRPETGHAPLPLVLIGTTAGTGSEVSGVAVLTDGETGRKKSISGPHCYARIAFADAAYTASAPLDVTISTALDALAHTVEGWFNPNCGEVTDLFTQKALELVWNGLLALDGAHALPDPTLREQLYVGSLYAGMVLNDCGTAFPHPMGYVLTEDFGIPHGRACTAFLPALVRRGMAYAPGRAAALFAHIGCGADALCETVRRLTAVDGVHMTPGQIASYTARFEGNANFTKTPGGFTPARAGRLLEELFG